MVAQARTVVLDEHGVLVRPEVAQRQSEADDAARREREAVAARQAAEAETWPGTPTYPPPDRDGASSHALAETTPSIVQPKPPMPKPRLQRRYHGAAKLSTLKMATEASKIAEEIVQHLAGLPGAKVRMRLEIEVELPEGVPEHVVRTVTENSRVLKLESYGFEEG